AWVSGNIIFSDYLNVMNIPHSGEMTVFIAALAGALIGFLWYNTYPAQVFMGDTGSLTIGGIIAVIAIAVRKELLLPVLCGVFLMAPLHDHCQKLGINESKIVVRCWIIGILLAVVTIVTLKIR